MSRAGRGRQSTPERGAPRHPEGTADMREAFVKMLWLTVLTCLTLLYLVSV
jgi:hypothetical protein